MSCQSRFRLFQFPTGWNSTNKTATQSCQMVVSIPNGMEFYNYSSGILAATEGFNSQRDGILPTLCYTLISLWAVSIPNGMEFYPIFINRNADMRCFNSQRDGILHYLYEDAHWLYPVSIPNGMEFYLAHCIKALLKQYVSIPNGMEFYE